MRTRIDPPRENRIHVLLADDERSMLVDLARRQRTTASEVVRRLVRDAASKELVDP